MKIIDLTAHHCPYPLVQIKLALKKMQPGELLGISISDSGSRRDVPPFLKKLVIRLRLLMITQKSYRWSLRKVTLSKFNYVYS
ncbi:sulfurtransferase TusA family protein [Shewanella sp. ENK2]|uniref:sulfurtransferase TusA family protein n=1 Tax=Shewanella sp. ENK2 TaxID=2775245 RepID=UPI00374878E7